MNAREMNCILCNKRFDKIRYDNRRKVNHNNISLITRFCKKLVNIGDPVCSACLKSSKRKPIDDTNDIPSDDNQNEFQLNHTEFQLNEAPKDQLEPTLENDDIFEVNETNEILDEAPTNRRVNLHITRATNTHRKCLICGRYTTKRRNNDFKTISQKAIVDVFVNTLILIPKGNRCCSGHLDIRGHLKDDALCNIPLAGNTSKLRPKEIENLIFALQKNHLFFVFAISTESLDFLFKNFQRIYDCHQIKYFSFPFSIFSPPITQRILELIILTEICKIEVSLFFYFYSTYLFVLYQKIDMLGICYFWICKLESSS
jgi:hypothetical protein